MEGVHAGLVALRSSATVSGCVPRLTAEALLDHQELIEDGRNNLVLRKAIEIGCPVRILQGVQDPDVPWQHAFKLTSCLPQDDVVLTLDPGRRSPPVAPQDIARLITRGEGVLILGPQWGRRSGGASICRRTGIHTLRGDPYPAEEFNSDRVMDPGPTLRVVPE